MANSLATQDFLALYSPISRKVWLYTKANTSSIASPVELNFTLSYYLGPYSNSGLWMIIFSPSINEMVYDRIDFYWVQCTLGKEMGQVLAHEILIPAIPVHTLGYKVKCNSFSYYRGQLNLFGLRKGFLGFLNSAPQHLGLDHSSLREVAMHWDVENTTGLYNPDASSSHPAVKTENASRHLHTSPRGHHSPCGALWIENKSSPSPERLSNSSSSNCSLSCDKIPNPLILFTSLLNTSVFYPPGQTPFPELITRTPNVYFWSDRRILLFLTGHM